MTPLRALILATTVADGEAYAKALGIEDYFVATAVHAARIQGLRVRAVVITPGFESLVSREATAYDEPSGVLGTATRLLMTANRNANTTGAPRG